MFDVEDGLVEQVGDVRIVEGIDDAAAAPFANHEPEASKDAQLLGDGGPFHLDGLATYNTEQRRTGVRSWGRGRWALIAIIVIAIVAVAIVLLTYTGGSSGGGGGGGY